jgi:hypothetical protein
MTPREQNELLEQVFEGDAAALREETLRTGLRAIRWKRRRRIGGYVALLILPWAVLFYPKHRAVPVVAQVVAPPKVQEISKEELFALFPKQQLALIGKPGEQELVFLDQPPPSSP